MGPSDPDALDAGAEVVIAGRSSDCAISRRRS